MPRKRGRDICIYTDQSPCYQCQDRWRTENRTCHSTCAKYAQYKDRSEDRKQARKTARMRDVEMDAYVSSRRKDTPAR